MAKNAALFKIREPHWSKAISRTKWVTGSFFEQWNHYGLKIAWPGFVWWVGIYSGKTSISVQALKRLTDRLDVYFENKYGDIITIYTNSQDASTRWFEADDCISEEDYPIWLFWFQGENSMPPLVKSCYRRLKVNNINVTLITRDNLGQYTNIPPAIYEKVAAGSISYTHLSDILRLTLLAERGGMWVDVTCFNPFAIPDEAKRQVFCSPHDTSKLKAKEYVYWCDSGAWRSWNLGTCMKHNPLFMFCRDMIQAIAINENCFPHYFMVDCLMCYAYRKIPGVKQMIDSQPDCNTKCADLFLLFFNANKHYDEKTYRNLIEKNWLFKLTYKTVWLEKVDGKETFYGKLLSSKGV